MAERREGGDYLLVSGAPRSGTTFVEHILNSHPEVACLHEYGFDELIVKLSAFAKYDESSIPSITALDSDLQSSVSLDDFARKRDGIAALHTGDAFLTFRKKDIPILFDAFFEVVSNKKNLKIRGDKTPNIVYLTDRLSSVKDLLGRLKRIYVIRKPADVIQSSMRRALQASRGHGVWRVATLPEAALEWADNWEHVAKELADDADDIHVIKYENLLAHFDEESAKLACFLNIDNAFRDLAAPVPQHLVDFRLDDAQIGEVQKLLGDVSSNWESLDLPSHLRQTPKIALNLDCTRHFKIGGNSKSKLLLRRGFSNIEPWGAWTNSNEAEIRFALNDAVNSIELSFIPFFPSMDFLVQANSGDKTIYSASKHRFRRSASISIPIQPPSRVIDLKLTMPRTKSPTDPPTTDLRRLGLGITQIRLS